MRYAGMVVALGICMLCPQELLSQDPDPVLERIRANSELGQNLVMAAGGLEARTLEDLVNSSSVIVRGRYGGIVSNKIQYPSGTKVDPGSPVRTRETAERGGLPLKVFEIEIDEIIKGNDVLANATSLQLGLVETADEQAIARIAPWIREYREGEHLFFLVQEINNTFALRGPMFDLKKSRDAFLYQVDQRNVAVFGSEAGEEFLESVRELAR